MKRIIHISLNEKFIDQANTFFEEAFEQQNHFYIVTYDQINAKLNYAQHRENVTLIGVDEMMHIVTGKDFQPDIIIFHSLDNLFFKYILAIPSNIPIVWIIFGYEVYNDPQLFNQKKLYFSKTYTYYKIIKDKSNSIFDLKQNTYIRYIYRLLWNKNLYLNEKEQEKEVFRSKEKAINRVNYLGAYFHEEFQRMTQILKTEHLKPFHFWYYPLEKKDTINIPIENRDNIIIGNSATPVCNHLDVIDKLKKLNLFKESDNYIIPLSYGLDIQYALKVKEGLNNVGSRITYLEKFIPIEQYNKILSSAKIAIIASRRQHAIGNTIQLILSGTKIFLSEDNPFFHFLKKNGIYIYSFENDLRTENFSALSPVQIVSNQEIIQKILDKDTQLIILRNQINLITSNRKENK